MPSRVQRLPWAVTWVLALAWTCTLTTAAIVPSNTSTSTAGGQFQGTLPLRKADSSQTLIADLVPLTREAAQRSIEGNLLHTTFDNVANISDNEIAYISCNPADYLGYADPQRVFEDAYRNANISGVLFYSTAANYCDYQQTTSQDMLQSFPVLSMTDMKASAALLDQIVNLPVSMKFFVKVQGRGDDSNSSGSGGGSGSSSSSGTTTNSQQANPLGPSPSTAVAMIILYSITGIITALFLVIIITGAIRAHRHPERYGPRDVLGRPRQSRARGLGRAILDTIPIVKFGEKDQEPPKPTDVELASTAENRTGSGENPTSTTDSMAGEPSPVADTTRHQHDANVDTAPMPKSTAPTPDREPATTIPTAMPAQEYQEGIAPAQPPALAAVSIAANGKDAVSHDQNLGCSICTEDFEKGQDLRVLPCDHKFHPDCVDPWLLNVSGTCPLCRVDLRPVSSNETSVHDPEDLSPPSNSNDLIDASHRRRTAFRDILSLRTRPNATPEERIYALRRLREQRQDRSDDGDQDHTNTHMDDASTNDRRRSKRLSLRLSEVFTGRSRRDRSPAQQGESSRSGATQQSPQSP